MIHQPSILTTRRVLNQVVTQGTMRLLSNKCPHYSTQPQNEVPRRFDPKFHTGVPTMQWVFVWSSVNQRYLFLRQDSPALNPTLKGCSLSALRSVAFPQHCCPLDVALRCRLNA